MQDLKSPTFSIALALFMWLPLLTGCSSIPAVKQGQTIEKYLQSIDFSGSVLVTQHNQIVHNKAYGFTDKSEQTLNTVHTPYLIGSLTKPFTALAIMQLHQQGKLDLSDPVDKYLPDFPNGKKITIYNLLTHSAGLYNFTNQWEDIKYADLSKEQLIALFRDKPLEFAPGTAVDYSNSGFILAGLIIEAVSEQEYFDYIKDHIFTPLHMTQSGQMLQDTDQRDTINNLTNTYAAGMLHSTTQDLHKWLQAFSDQNWVSPESYQAIFPTDRNGLGQGFGTGQFKVVVGLGWFNYQTDHGAEYSHEGHIEGYSALIARYPDKQTDIIILSNKDQYDVWTLKQRLTEILFRP